ncbi:MAG: hypothetical protein ACJ74J_02605 [Blastocatellia bacterium]
MKMTSRFLMAVALVAAFGVINFAGAQTEGQGQPEVFKIPHRSNPHDGGAPTTGGTGTVTPAITWHGGPVMAGTVTIYYIFYGNWNQSNGSDNAAGKQILIDFANSIGGSPYEQLNTTYSISGSTITGAVSYGGSVSDAYSQGTRLRDSSILAIVNNAINNLHLGTNANSIYFVLTSSDVAETSGFCTQYCGWHTAATSGGRRLRYSFVGNANRCLNACAAQTIGPNGNAGVDGMISVVAHELEEAISDPDLNAWFDSGGAENADKCAWTFGHAQYQTANGAWANMQLGTRNFLIQRNLQHNSSGDLCKVNANQN